MHSILCGRVSGAQDTREHERSITILTTSKLDLPRVQISDKESKFMAKRGKQRKRQLKRREAGAARYDEMHAPNMSSLTHPVPLRATTVAKAIAPANMTNPFL